MNQSSPEVVLSLADVSESGTGFSAGVHSAQMPVLVGSESTNCNKVFTI